MAAKTGNSAGITHTPKTESSQESQQSQEDDTTCDNSDLDISANKNTFKDLAPDGGWGWCVVAGAMLSLALMGGFERASGIVYLELDDRYHGSAAATAWIFSVFIAFRLLLGPVASTLCNRYSCRMVVFIGGLLSGLSFIISGFAPNLTFLYFSYGLLGGLGRCMTTTPSLIMVGYYFNKRRGLAIGLATAGVGIGTFFIPPIVELLFQTYTFTGSFLIMGAMSFNFLLSACLYRPLHKEPKSNPCQIHSARGRQLDATDDQGKEFIHHEDSEQPLMYQDTATTQPSLGHKSEEMEAKKSKFSSHLCCCKQSKFNKNKNSQRKAFDIRLLKKGLFLSFCAGTTLFTTAFHASFVFLPPLINASGISELQAAFVVSVTGVVDSVSRVIFSTILDLKRVKPFRIYIYNAVMFLLAGVCLMIPFMSTFIQFAIVGGLFGALCGSYISQKSLVIIDMLSVEDLSSALGFLGMFQGIGSLMGPAAGGLLKDNLESYTGAFYFGSTMIFLGALIFMAGNISTYFH